MRIIRDHLCLVSNQFQAMLGIYKIKNVSVIVKTVSAEVLFHG